MKINKNIKEIYRNLKHRERIERKRKKKRLPLNVPLQESELMFLEQLRA